MSTRAFRFAVQGAGASSLDEWVSTARRAEELGYSTLLASDHYVGPGGPPTGIQELAAVPAIAVAAATTTTLRVGFRVLCVDFHLPAVLVKEAATIELLSQGRLELGLGAGWVADEYEVLGVPFDRIGVRIERLAEVIQLVKAYFAGEELDLQGSHVRVHGFRGSPPPVQQPRPPLMIGGGAQRILTLAGREADIVSLNFNNRAGVVGPDSLQSSTAEETDHKIGWIRDGAGDRFDDIELEIAAYFTTVTDDPDAAATALGSRFGVDSESMRSHPHALIGSVAEICDILQRRRDRYGISYVTVATRYMEAFSSGGGTPQRLMNDEGSLLMDWLEPRPELASRWRRLDAEVRDGRYRPTFSDRARGSWVAGCTSNPSTPKPHRTQARRRPAWTLPSSSSSTSTAFGTTRWPPYATTSATPAWCSWSWRSAWPKAPHEPRRSSDDNGSGPR